LGILFLLPIFAIVDQLWDEEKYLEEEDQSDAKKIEVIVLDVATIEDEQGIDCDEHSFLKNEEHSL
jgi:hypothetical protein